MNVAHIYGSADMSIETYLWVFSVPKSLPRVLLLFVGFGLLYLGCQVCAQRRQLSDDSRLHDAQDMGHSEWWPWAVWNSRNSSISGWQDVPSLPERLLEWQIWMWLGLLRQVRDTHLWSRKCFSCCYVSEYCDRRSFFRLPSFTHKTRFGLWGFGENLGAVKLNKNDEA
jgi:hypothetical protein